jgi:hypothetical protein
MLDRVAEGADGTQHQKNISWLPNGRGFKVLSPRRFAEETLPFYFDTLKYKSFIRQINIYGFQRQTTTKERSNNNDSKEKGVHDGNSNVSAISTNRIGNPMAHKNNTPSKNIEDGAYFHPAFVRGKPDLCWQMKRQKVKGTGTPRGQQLHQQQQRTSIHTRNSSDNRRNDDEIHKTIMAQSRSFPVDAIAVTHAASATSSILMSIPSIISFSTESVTAEPNLWSRPLIPYRIEGSTDTNMGPDTKMHPSSSPVTGGNSNYLLF